MVPPLSGLKGYTNLTPELDVIFKSEDGGNMLDQISVFIYNTKSVKARRIKQNSSPEILNTCRSKIYSVILKSKFDKFVK
jgi:hypothetical protein